MLNQKLRISVISDIHLGHRKNKTEFIIGNLNQYFSNESHLSSVDMVVLAGDVFDDLLLLSDEDVHLIDYWIARLLTICRKYGVIVRVLEGTPSHDRAQSKRFVVIKEILDGKTHKPLDLRYVDTLSIEYIPKFAIDVLYVPDEWNHSYENVLQQVKGLLSDKGLDKVDFSFMHGSFEHQLPTIVKNVPKHDAQAYLDLTRYLIFIGHIHTHSVYERIFAQGSFDRLAHGEESPKGFLTAQIEPSGDYQMTFVENITAKKFVTIACSDGEISEVLKDIDSFVKHLPAGSFIRLRLSKKSPIITSMDTVYGWWPTMQWSTKVVDDVLVPQDVIVTNNKFYMPVNINRHNLMELVLARLSASNLSDEETFRCITNLKEAAGLT